MGDGQRLLTWACDDGAVEVELEDASMGEVWFSSMTAWFTTSVEGVVAILGVAATPQQIRVSAASFVPPLDVDAVAGDRAPASPENGDDELGPVSRAAIDFDHVAALAELANECVIARYPYDERLPASVQIGDRAAVTVPTLQRISGAKAPRLTDREIWRQVDELIEEYARTPGRKGLPGAVAERLGVSVRTAHRYIAAVRAQQDETVEVRFYKTNMEVE
jgi:hypothetical protein